ncbi:hypothetical protein BLA29_015488, partial [Euroglyphus maynei]
KRKESVTKSEEEKDITEETQVTVTEEIIELPHEEQRQEEIIKENDKEKPEEDKPKKHSKKVKKPKPENIETESEE